MARQNLTVARVSEFRCPPGKSQAFLWDAKVPGLALRVTASGARAFVFQSRLRGGNAVRITIGSPETWTIPAAQAEARRLQGLIDRGVDPRAERAETSARHAAEREAAKAERARRRVTGLDAWGAYCEARRKRWSERHYSDHLKMTAPGGVERARSREKLTRPGLLHGLLNRPLADVDADAVGAWASREAKVRPGSAALAFRLLSVFVNWCVEHPEYRAIVRADACKGRKVRETLGKPNVKNDALQREQLRLWFDAVRALPPVPAAYLQALLLTGARREEVASLRWEDVEFRWRSLRIRDKVDGERVIPLPPYLASVFRELKLRNDRRPDPPRSIRSDPEKAEEWRRKWRPSPWVFSSKTASEGRLKEPRIAHNRALAAAGLPHLTLHGLRRSFGTLSEWLEAPAGVVAQIQGHKPSAIAEKHYRVRPLDLLRSWHDRIEEWILSEAGIEQPKVDTASRGVARLGKAA